MSLENENQIWFFCKGELELEREISSWPEDWLNSSLLRDAKVALGEIDLMQYEGFDYELQRKVYEQKIGLVFSAEAANELSRSTVMRLISKLSHLRLYGDEDQRKRVRRVDKKICSLEDSGFSTGEAILRYEDFIELMGSPKRSQRRPTGGKYKLPWEAKFATYNELKLLLHKNNGAEKYKLAKILIAKNGNYRAITNKQADDFLRPFNKKMKLRIQ